MLGCFLLKRFLIPEFDSNTLCTDPTFIRKCHYMEILHLSLINKIKYINFVHECLIYVNMQHYKVHTQLNYVAC